MMEVQAVNDIDGAYVSRKILEMSKRKKPDLASVTLCKDCAHAYINSFAEASGTALRAFWTNRVKGEAVVMQADDFCSYGKPKEASDER